MKSFDLKTDCRQRQGLLTGADLGFHFVHLDFYCACLQMKENSGLCSGW